jgi:ribosomal protein S18 acetylase RimI-like enzyme
VERDVPGASLPGNIDSALAEWYDLDSVRALIDDEAVACFVAERDRAVVGYASGSPSDEDAVAFLGAIYVDPDRWGDGIGTALLEEFETYWGRRGYEAVRLFVLSGNDVGGSFYRRHGYVPVDERETELFGKPVTERVLRGPID